MWRYSICYVYVVQFLATSKEAINEDKMSGFKQTQQEFTSYFNACTSLKLADRLVCVVREEAELEMFNILSNSRHTARCPPTGRDTSFKKS